MKKIFLLLVVCFVAKTGFSQNAVAINTDASAPQSLKVLIQIGL